MGIQRYKKDTSSISGPPKDDDEPEIPAVPEPAEFGLFNSTNVAVVRPAGEPGPEQGTEANQDADD